MDSKIQQQLLDKTSAFLQQASHTLGTGASHVYAVLIRQQFVEGATSIIQFVIGMIFILIGLPRLWSACKKADKEGDDDGFALVGGGILGVGLFLMFGALILSALGDAIGKLINPEYYAISFIFNQLNQSK